MAVEIRIPRLGWTMEEGIFQGWLKEDGDRIKCGESIFVLEGEKAVQEIEACDEGILKIDSEGPAAGSAVAVGALIGYLLAEGEQAEFDAAVTRPDDHGGSDQPPALISPSIATSPLVSRIDPEIDSVGVAKAVRTISPRAARKAAALGVDWTKVSGTGRTGRIRERDVIAAAAEQIPGGHSRQPR